MLAWVYPRVCGGTAEAFTGSTVFWGKRSIPACAGEPDSCASVPDSGNDGLSPRVRGNPIWHSK